MQQTLLENFFKRAPPKNEKEPPVRKKRKAVVISSDEEIEEESPQAAKSRELKKTCIEKSHKSPGNKSSLSKLKNASKDAELKRVDPKSLFGGETTRIAAKKLEKPKEKALLEMEDNEIDRSLMDLDVDVNGLHVKTCDDTNSKTANNSSANTQQDHREDGKKSSIKSEPKNEATSKGTEKSQRKHTTEGDAKPKASASSSAKKEKHASGKPEKLDSPKKPQHSQKISPKSEQPKSTPKTKKEPHADLNASVISDEERFERRRLSYQNYKNRPSCLNPGSKEVPQGKQNCLAGLSFLVTGVLESLERSEAEEIVKQYGGKIMTTVGKRLSYLIAGEEAGVRKLEKAQEFSIRVISEDEFFDLIRKKSGDVLQSKKADEEAVSSETKSNTSPTKKLNEKKQSSPQIKKEKEKTPAKKSKLEANVSPAKTTIKEENLQVDSGENVKQGMAATVAETTENADSMAWVDKYKPKTVKDIIGQQGAASNLVKLTNWLSNWYINHNGKKKLQKPSPWAKNNDGAFFKAALLSGPPGVGKTTTATLVCKQLGFDTVEFNASDTRSKRLLKEEVAELLSNKSLYGYFHGSGQAVTKKHVLLMDEVDGMAGNEDRGGIQELIALIKDSSVPIICMCNDRNHQKIRSLVNHCYDLRFNKPMLKQIKGYIMGICCKEKLKLDPAKVDEIISATNNDIRQTINHISLLSAGNGVNLKPTADNNDVDGHQLGQKDLKIGPWDVVRKVFSAEEHKHMNFNDKCDLFFHDYSLSPLFVQQNYLQVSPSGPKSDVLQKVALTADALSLGDLVDKRIRSNSAWSLLPTQAVFSSVMPGEYMCGHFTGQINFPAWLGKNSRSNKLSRLAQEIHNHTRLRTSGSRQSIRLDYAPFLLASILRPLQEKGTDGGVEQALEVVKHYQLLREDIDSLMELTAWPGKKNGMDAVESRVKAALTRAYNKEVMAYSYSATAGVKKKKNAADDELLGLEGDDGESGSFDTDDEEVNDDLANDALIKAKKKSVTTAASSSASTSKANGGGKTSKKPNAGTTKPKSAANSKSKK